MPTDTFDIASDADDGGAHYFSGVSWAAILSGTFTADDSTLCSVARSNNGAGGFLLYNCFFRFDTSSLPDTATISSAVLRLELMDKGDPDGDSVAGDYYDFGGEASVAGDMEVSSSADAIASRTYASISTGSTTDLTLINLGNINKTGVTGIRLAPATTGSPSGDNFLDFASREHATGASPQLLVTYTIATQTIRPDADITTTGWTTTPLWSKIEETSADGTVITATAS